MVKLANTRKWCDGSTPLAQVLDEIETILDGDSGVDTVGQYPHPGNLSRPRRAEIAAAINRLRGVQMVHVDHARSDGNKRVKLTEI